MLACTLHPLSLRPAFSATFRGRVCILPCGAKKLCFLARPDTKTLDVCGANDVCQFSVSMASTETVGGNLRTSSWPAVKRGSKLTTVGSLAMAATSSSGMATTAVAEGSDAMMVFVTVPNEEVGKKLASGLVEAKLAACVNRIQGIESTYWWKGKVESDQEHLLIIKTQKAVVPELTEFINKNHPYELAEVIAIPIAAGSERYLKWIEGSVKAP
eukprot:TRINITY_DN3085_c0_g1_i1.p1 TRINITY_DN3085_c0_g1~~TRINITY_DN3085_c0_g1_i1.p1  ORF type:complete len:214 (-),score=41.87 TRINITY_DN3085_c0_g1_i1:282-923(-)